MKNLNDALKKSIHKSFLHLIIFSFITNALSLALPIYSLQVLDRVLGSSSVETLLYLSIIIFICLFCMNAINFIRNMAFDYIANNFHNNLLDKAFKSAFKDIDNASNKNIKNLEIIKNFITSRHLAMIFDAPWIIIFLAVVFYIHIIPGFIILASVIVMIILSFLGQHILKKYNEDYVQKKANIHIKNDFLIQNSEAVMAMKMEDDLLDRFLLENEDLEKDRISINKKNQKVEFFTKSLRFLVQIFITIASAILIINGKMSAGGYIAILILAAKILAPFDAFAGILTNFTKVKDAYIRMSNDLKESWHQKDKTKLPNPIGNIVSNSLFYVANNKAIISGLSFKINNGEIIGIIGKSGSGKTSLARLLSGVLTPTQGKVNIDDTNLKNWNKKQLSNYIGYLPQDVELFHGSVKENIARMKSKFQDEDVINAAIKTFTHSLIASLPNGYETIINNYSLSAGQKQQIALARAFFGDVKLVILDEPNSNLDTDGENNLIKTLEDARKNKITVIIISHKPSVLKFVDKVMLLDKGKLVRFDKTNEIITNFSK